MPGPNGWCERLLHWFTQPVKTQMYKNVLDREALLCLLVGMENEITPQSIEDMAVEARVPMVAVFRRSGVAPGSFYRWKRGEGEMLPLTKARLMDAIGAIKENAA